MSVVSPWASSARRVGREFSAELRWEEWVGRFSYACLWEVRAWAMASVAVRVPVPEWLHLWNGSGTASDVATISRCPSTGDWRSVRTCERLAPWFPGRYLRRGNERSQEWAASACLSRAIAREIESDGSTRRSDSSTRPCSPPQSMWPSSSSTSDRCRDCRAGSADIPGCCSSCRRNASDVVLLLMMLSSLSVAACHSYSQEEPMPIVCALVKREKN